MTRSAMALRPGLKASFLPLLALLSLASAQTPVPVPASPAPVSTAPAAIPALPPGQTRPARPRTQPGQVQPVAPGTLPAPRLPTLNLTPAIPQVRQVNYLGNGFIEVAYAVVTVTPAERGNLRPLVDSVVKETFAARPGLSEVDVSVYDAGSYAGFGGPLPILTASVPRERQSDFAAWVDNKTPYERVWVNPGHLPPYLRPEKVLELAPRPATQNEKTLQSRARVRGGLVDGLLYRGKPSGSRIAALTFDDSPHPLYEPLLLDLLRRAGVRATFFVIGRNAVAFPYFIRDMVEQGHEVGNHTYHHVRLTPLPLAQAAQEMDWANDAISAISGQPVRYFRPPGGDYTAQTLSAAQSLGLSTVFWTDDPGDFQNPGVAVLQSRLAARLLPGGIVLLHDNAPQMLDVLQGFLRSAKQRGYLITTVGALPK